MSSRENSRVGFVRRGQVLKLVAGCLMETQLRQGKEETVQPVSISSRLYKESRLYVLNIAPAYFVVNYSDVNCIVNKAATFLSFPIILIKMCGCREPGEGSKEPKWESGWRLQCLASRMKEPAGGRKMWVPSPGLQGGRYWWGLHHTAWIPLPVPSPFHPQQAV